ncbi:MULTISPECIES: SpoIIE family protein phosphatase [unclassified Ruminococcus]|uniref:SpoIIE family protein phosphatase n=1 Tax=unclassified Ruminococcus TaxID=2608920 RepID=UPI00210A97CB|nr:MULTISPECIES: SpoIIE family protein phosphatase [unclassified Ruminococcus]MCQ4022300.1 SpoIIE family protein phosphatase [Ruminococcus sp. zg-924]MCQ4114628.1 SpoIIE family protein phosphatase [Ruminococcus sp. zg-921]
MNNLCTDIAFNSVIKHGEQLCGDKVELIEQSDNSYVMVLADGLGSGVKANILATLTSKIISTMMANNLSIEDCVETIALTLPVCNVRQIAYSTFTIIRVVNSEEAEIIQYDNPQVIILRDGKSIDYPKTITEIEGKTIFKSKIKLQENDVFIAMSDGAIYAGVGKTMNFGWQRDNIVTFMEQMYDPEYTAKALCNLLLDECNRLYGGEPGDDTTIGTIKIRKRSQVNLLFGPPSNPDDAGKMHSLFFAKGGKHIVCGGTTSSLVAKYLNKPMNTSIDYLDPEIPPTATIEGVDLVTEGVITMSKVLEYAKHYLESSDLYSDWSFKKDGASQIARMLFEQATDINFYVGRAINPAHQNPNLPITFNIKMQIVEELSECLKKMGKRIKVSYF